MRPTDTEILLAHIRRYPQMQPQDFAKLLYQAEFGPRHLQSAAEASSAESLLSEWQQMPASPNISPAEPAEPISGELCRFHLSAAYRPEEAAPLLAQLFQLTQGRKGGTTAGLNERIKQLMAIIAAQKTSLAAAQIAEWLQNWLQEGAPPVHHSEIFRRAYQPHYRLLCTELAGFFPALLACRQLLAKTQAKPLLIAIDGRCGSGKTGLAALLQQTLPPQTCRLIHMDDFYLPASQRPTDWQQTPAGHMDLPRLQKEVLQPAAAGEAIVYQPYDCQKVVFAGQRKLPPARLTIIEGSYALHPLLAGHYALKIFLTLSQTAQANRLQEREGAYYSNFVERWIPQEERYLQAYNIENTADLNINTDQLF